MESQNTLFRFLALSVLIFCLFSSCGQKREVDEKAYNEHTSTLYQYKLFQPVAFEAVLLKPGDIEAEVGTCDSRVLFDKSQTRWPADVPSSISEFYFGKIVGTITSTVNGQKTYSFLLSNLEDGYVGKFHSFLKGLGHKAYLLTRSDSLVFSHTVDYQVSLSGNSESAKLSISLPDDGGETGKTMDLKLLPRRTYVGGSVTISGTTVEYEGNKTVKAVFFSPDGKTYSVTSKLNENGEFELIWGPLEIVGIWFVEVTGPLSDLIGEKIVLSFDVFPPAVVTSISIGDFSAGIQQIEGFVEVTRQEIDLFTVEVPDKNLAKEKVDELLESISAVDGALNELASEFDNLYAEMLPLKQFPEFQETLSVLAASLEPSLNQIQTYSRLLRVTHEAANRAGDWCRTWHAQKEGLKIVAEMGRVIAGGMATIKSWAAGKFSNSIKNLRNDLLAQNAQEILGLTDKQINDGRDALSKIEKTEKRIKELTDVNGSMGGWLSQIYSTGTNWIIDWIANKVAPNCGMYNAEVTGRLVIDYYAKGMKYMVASYRWGGCLELFFEKRKSSNEIVELKGQIWGSFGWQIGLFSPQLLAMDIPGVKGLGICVPRPPFLDFRDFFITLEGSGDENKVELEVKSVQYDKPRISFGYISVLWSPYQIVPAIDFINMDVPGGEWFITRITGLSDPDVDFFYIPLKVEGDVVKLEHDFSRTLDYKDSAQFEARLTMEVKGVEGEIGSGTKPQLDIWDHL